MKPTLALRTLAAALALAACAPAAPPAASPAHGGDAVEAAATLLRLEDRREFDEVAIAHAAASPSPWIRGRAALAAGRIRDARGLPVLLRLLANPDTSVAATAAFALGHLGDTTAVGALLSLLAPERAADAPTVAGEAAAALGKLGTERGRETVAGLLRAAPADAPGARESVGRALLAAWKFPREADLEPITRWTASADPELRWRAAYALTRRPDPAATPTLARLSADPDWRVRSLVMRGLTAPLADSSIVGAEAAREPLLRALGDPDWRVRVNAARSLGTHAHPSSVAALRGLLGAEEVHLAVAAAESLGRLGPAAAETAPELAALALDPSRNVGLRSAALLALASVAPGDASAVAARLAEEESWRVRAAAARAYAAVGPVPEALLRDRDPRAAAAALGAAVQREGADLSALRPALLEALGHPDVGVRTSALGGLAKLADPATLPAVLDAYARARADTLNDAALAALGALDAFRKGGVEVAEPFFARFERSPDSLVRQAAEAVFGDAALRAWGAALPVETGRSPEEYRAVVREWVLPALAGDEPRVRIATESGAFDLRLFAAEAPLTVLNFVRLAEAGYFDRQEWPRVVPNFVIQGGDPRGDQSGGPGYAIRDEINRHPYLTGTLGMALSGPDTGGSQFFVTHSPQPHLDGGYTVFGEVVEGMEVVDRVRVGETILGVTRVH